jgi:hypothetical protein
MGLSKNLVLTNIYIFCFYKIKTMIIKYSCLKQFWIFKGKRRDIFVRNAVHAFLYYSRQNDDDSKEFN